jgi:hypothetical protein
MSLLFFDGFDHVGETAPSGSIPKWGDTYYWHVTTSGAARTGVGCLKAYFTGSSTQYYAQTKPRVTSGGVVVGGAFFLSPGVAGTNTMFLEVREGSISHLGLQVNALNRLEIRRGATIIATGQLTISPNSWFFLEFKAVIHPTTGTYEVHVDGAVDPGLVGTGANTQNGGSGVWDRIHFTGTGTLWVDDFYLCDTNGAAPYNTFLGPVRVETLFPQTDAVAVGSNQGLTPSTGTDHGALVDENPPNTTDFNSSAQVGVKDTYNYPSMTYTGTVFAVQPQLYVNKSDSSGRQICPVVRVNGVDYDAVPSSLSVTWGYVSNAWHQNPNTLVSWTVADVAALQAGMKILV